MTRATGRYAENIAGAGILDAVLVPEAVPGDFIRSKSIRSTPRARFKLGVAGERFLDAVKELALEILINETKNRSHF